MSNVGFSTLTVIPSFKGFQGKLTAGTAGPMASAGRVGGKKYGDAAGKEAGDRFKGGFTSKLKGFAPLAGLGLGVGAVAFFKDAIAGASDLSESGNKINAIFGKAQDEVQDFAAGSAKALGQTQLQALDAASTFGTFGKAAGLAGSDLAGFSTELVSLSTDMASFYNTDVSTAIEAIGSGLRGEAEPLRQFGVLLDDATLREEALRQGLIETTKQALTPQQKVLSAHAVIMQQTTDAQGDFLRTSDGLANQQRILTAQWEEMKAKVGAELLPAMTGFVSFLSQDALPVLGEVGGSVKDAASAFDDLPAPVKASAAAFVALRIAAATGLTASVASGAASLSSAMVGLRLRTMLAADAFRDARTTTMAFNGNVGTVSRKVGVLTASMQGLRVGAAGAGTAIKSGLGGAIGILGGPWGIAMIGATAAVAHFWQENQAAKQRIEDMTASLDAQTGALSDNTRELVYKSLVEAGAIKTARELGISLEDVQLAAQGNDAAYRRVTLELDNMARAMADSAAENGRGSNIDVDRSRTIEALRDAIGTQNAEVAKSRQAWRDHADAMGETTEANKDSAESFASVRDRIKETRTEIRRLADEENKRREAATGDKRDQLAFIQTLKDAEKEARKGKPTLDENTKAGQANWRALLEVADGWNETKESARNTRKAYREMRQDFIDIAKEMGANDKKARHLADTYLSVPESMKTEITTPGMDKALRDLEKLKDRVKSARDLAIYVNAKQEGDPRLKNFATGGRVGGYGTGDNQLILADPREWVINPKAVDYYGNGFMDALNKMRLPRFAQGGQVGTSSPAPRPSGGGVQITIGQVVAHDYDDFMRQVNRRARSASGGGVNF